MASAVVAGLVAGSAVAGLRPVVAGEAQDPVLAMLRGYDAVALAAAAPLLGGSLLPGLRQSPRAQLVSLGVLAFGVYHYAYYVFGPIHGAALPVHVAVLALSAVALLLGLRSLDVEGIAATFAPRWVARPAALALLALALSLGAMWAVFAAKSVTTGEALAEPSRLVLPAEMTGLGAILDVSLLVPSYLLVGVLLWRRSAWGFVLAPVLLLAGSLHQVAYMAGLVSQARAGIHGASAWDPAEPVIAGAFGAAAAALLAACGRNAPGARHRPG